MPLTQRQLRWFYEAEKLLRERFQINTRRKEDMGRLHCVRIFKPDGSLVGTGDITDVNGEYTFSYQYAAARRNEAGTDYSDEAKAKLESGDRIGMQGTFHVEMDGNGEYTMHSDIPEEELRAIFEDAMAGRLVADPPGTNILSDVGGSMYLCLAKNGGACACNAGLKTLRTLSDDDFRAFVDRHPEYMGENMNKYEVLQTAEAEIGSFQNVGNGQELLRRVSLGARGILGAVPSEEQIEEVQYELEYWKSAHWGVPPLSKNDQKEMDGRLEEMLGESGLQTGLSGGEGFENFFCRNERGEMVSFGAYLNHFDGMPEGQRIAFSRRAAMELIRAGNLFVCGDDANRPGEKSFFKLEQNESGQIVQKKVPQRPPHPGFRAWLGHVLHIRWRRGMWREYEQRLRQRQEMLDTESAAVTAQEALRPAEREEPPAEEPKQEKKKEPLTAETLENTLAEMILTNRRMALIAGRYRMLGKTVEDVKREELFRAYMKSETVLAAVEKLKNGRTAEVNTSNLLMDFRRMETAAKQPEQSHISAEKKVGMTTERREEVKSIRKGP